MKIIIVLLSFISCLAITPRASGQGDNKTELAKNAVVSFGSVWVPRLTKEQRKSYRWPVPPSARIIAGKHNPNGNPDLENIVLKSTDGGQTWQDISEGLPANLQDAFFSNNNGLYLRAGDGIYRNNQNSSDASWIKEVCPSTYNFIAPGKRRMFAISYGGQIFQKADGKIWSPVYSNFKEAQARTVFESAAGPVFIGTDNGLFKTVDNGKTWKKVHGGGWVMKLVESNGVLMATCQKGILRSTDLGENWDLVISEGGVGITVEVINGGFAAITFNTYFESRKIRASYDNGKSWQEIDGGLPPDMLTSSIVQAGEYLYCGHPLGIFRSSDKGKTWTLLLSSIGEKVFNLYISGDVIYAVPRNGGC